MTKTKYDSLAEAREVWEDGAESAWKFTTCDAVIVIIEWEYDNANSYSVHRYFRIGVYWVCSVDVPQCNIRGAIANAAHLVTDHYHDN